MLFVCYPKCTTCQKAAKWLDAQGIPVTVRDIKQDNPTEQELRTWHKMSGLPLKRFFNTSGLQYKALGLKDKLPQMRGGTVCPARDRWHAGQTSAADRGRFCSVRI